MSDQAASNEGEGQASSRAAWLLGVGAFVGLVMAAVGLLGNEATTADLPDGTVARINGTILRGDDFERLVAAVLEDMRAPDEAKARKRVLERMVDEELLIQRALELGLAHLDRKVRADLTSAMITSVIEDVRNLEPGEDELEAFYAENREYFTRPGRLHARQIFFRVSARGKSTHPRGDAVERSNAAHAALLAGDDYETVEAEFGDMEVAPIPAAMLPANKLREYTGPTLLRAIYELEVGGFTKPVRSGMGIHIAQLAGRGEAVIPTLAEIRDQVIVDWRRRQGDKALRDYLAELRDYAVIEIAEAYEDAAQ
ncbi:MAG: peptidyl-prolyl cis-trans isomerase [Myxococcota bacterium]|jgi:parvulin-like peptidyl-prolyl isomerase|nr:peptidyl-prolyl cis-trans isomerase [Myxococcota bacterium]